VSGNGALFGAHGLRTVDRGRSGHSGIIAATADFGLRTPDVSAQA
jgi:hypothetical protein